MTMTNYRITTPVKDYTGEVAGVAFAKGVGATSSLAALSYFRSAGYGVEPLDEQKAEPQPVQQEPVEVQPPAKSASKTDWVEFAVKHRGADQAEAEKLTHAQLVAEYGPKGEEQ